MKKRLLMGVFCGLLVMGMPGNQTAQANRVGTCASQCGARPLQFTPGQYVRIEVINRTPRVLQLQKMNVTNLVSIAPGKAIQFPQMQVTEPNASIIFWDETGRALKAVVSQPHAQILRVELRPDWYPPGDRSIYIRDDGRVNVL